MSAVLPRDGNPPRGQCARYIEGRGRQCRGKAEPGDLWCRFHGGKAPSHEGKKQNRIEDYRDQVLELADAAVDTIQEMLVSPNHAVRLRASLEILDRAGISTVRKSETTTTVTQRSELDAKIEELLGAGSPAHSPENEERPLPAHSFSDASADPSRAASPPDHLGAPEGFGGGSGLGLSGPAVSDDDDGHTTVD